MPVKTALQILDDAARWAGNQAEYVGADRVGDNQVTQARSLINSYIDAAVGAAYEDAAKVADKEAARHPYATDHDAQIAAEQIAKNIRARAKEQR